MNASAATACVMSPIGMVELAAHGNVLTSIRIRRVQVQGHETLATGHALLAESVAQVRAWFAGTLQAFDLPLEPAGSAEGEALRAGIAAIPYGQTRTYGDVAALTGSVARAVGQACKTNAFPLVIPCHRVTSAAGPEYYSAGEGPRTKTWLLDFEHDHLPPDQRTRLL